MAHYTKVNLRDDVTDMAPQFGMEGMEARFARTNLELDGAGVSLFRIAPDHRAPFGHHHETQEEIYLVLEGEITMKLGDDVITLGPRDEVFIEPSTPRGTRNDGDVTTVFAMVSAKMDDPMAETNTHENFWL